MKSLFDVENLPSEFGGKATLKYNHEEFSKMMEEDDLRTASYWEIASKPCHISDGYSGAETATLAPPAS